MDKTDSSTARASITNDRRSPRWLVLMRGQAGTGKSTLARALARRLGWALIDKDDIKDIIDGHTPESGRLAYAVMFRIARRQLDAGVPVICDSPLTYAGLYDEARALATAARARIAVIETACSDEAEWQRRIDARAALGLPAHHQTDWQRFQCVRAAWDAAAYPIDAPRLTLDTARPAHELARDIAGWLAAMAGDAMFPYQDHGIPGG